MTTDTFAFIVWAVTGIVILTGEEVPKIVFGGTWFTLMLALFCNCIE